MLVFRVLGPIEVANESGVLALGGPKQRALLADLIVNAGRVVSTAQLVDDLWGDRPPQTAGHTVETYVSRLRRILRDGSGPDLLLTRAPGYLLNVAPDRVDVLQFERLLEEGTDAAQRGDDEAAARSLRAALTLWRGAALADISLDAPFAEAAARRMEERRLLAQENLMRAELELGRGREVIAELESLVVAHPYREPFHAQLMLALYRSGRQTDALAAYRRARDVLVDELGIDPGRELRDLEQAILRQDPSLDRKLTPTAAVREVREAPPAPSAPSRPPPRIRGGRRASLLAISVALALIAVVVPLTVRHAAGIAAVPANGIGVLSPSGAAVTAGVPVPSGISSLAAGAGAIWATSPEAHAVYRIDPVTRSINETIPVGAGAAGIALGKGVAWVANTLDGTVSRIDTSIGRVVQTIGAGSSPTSVAVGGGAVWVTDPYASAVYQIDQDSGQLLGTIDLTSGPSGIALGAGSIWVSDPLDDSVTRIDPVAAQPVGRISVGADPGSIVFGLGSLWVANGQDSTVSRIDPGTGRVTQTIPVGDGPVALTIGATSVWVADAAAGTVVRIDPRAGRVASSLHIGGRPSAATVVGGTPWIAVRPSFLQAHRGGTLRIVSSAAAQTIDPALGYPNVGLNDGIYDTLIAYQQVGGSAGLEMVPNLAVTVPAPQAGGTEYTFVLRPGLRYSNGAYVRPEDFRYGLERVFELNPYERSFFSGIEGSNRCESGSPCDLSQGITVDDHARAVTFHLAAPDAEFLYKVADFTQPAPSSVPRGHDVGTTPVPATGPYMISKVVPGKELIQVRNPQFREWSAAAEPDGYPDRIVWTFGLSVDQEVAAIEQGRADWMADPVPDLGSISARYARQLHVNPIPGTASAGFNTTAPPFDDVRVRQAVSLGLDRRKAVTVFGGPGAAQPTCQFIPPGLPGYRPYCPYTVDPGADGQWIGPDLARARDLIAESHAKGSRVVVWAHSMDQGLGSYFVGQLNRLGFRASLHLATDAEFNDNVNDSRRNVQVAVSEWIVDFPSPSDIFDLFLRCSTFTFGDPADTRSGAFFCHPGIDRQMDEADRLQISDPARAAKVWATVDREITDLAPSVQLVSLRWVDFTSARVGNYEYSAKSGALLDQFWVR